VFPQRGPNGPGVARAGQQILPWDQEAVDAFNRLRAQGTRVGTQDMKIAAIALAHDALLLTRNAVDFARVPGLRFENWLDEGGGG
jgi:tRNA(fMet)-specific endonuclease VapC